MINQRKYDDGLNIGQPLETSSRRLAREVQSEQHKEMIRLGILTLLYVMLRLALIRQRCITAIAAKSYSQRDNVCWRYFAP